MSTIYQAVPTLPPLAATIITVCVFVMLAGLAIWLAARAAMEFVRMAQAAIEADERVAQMKARSDKAALEYWIRDSFRRKAEAELEAHRAKQEAYARRQIAQGAKNMEGGKA